MSNDLTKKVIGALVALALAAAVSYGLISQPTADKVQNQTNQTLNNGSPQQPAPQVPAPQSPTPQAPGTQTPAPAGTAPQNPAPAPRP